MVCLEQAGGAPAESTEFAEGDLEVLADYSGYDRMEHPGLASDPDAPS